MTMASLNKNALGSDDEDDLESLRLAALMSLKPKITTELQSKLPASAHCKPQHPYNKPTFGAAQTTRHHNRGFRNNSGRGRNGMGFARTNTNLISIQTIDHNETKEVQDNSISVDVPKLILPQDRYHKPPVAENIQKEISGNKFDRYGNKFDRYDNSEDSESDSDEQVIKLNRRERKDSLELLMDDLENEINILDGKDELKPTKDKLNKNAVINQIESQDDNKLETHEISNLTCDTLIISEIESDLVQLDTTITSVKEEKFSILATPPSPSYTKIKSPSPEKSKIFQRRKSQTKSRSRSPCTSNYKSPYRSPKRSHSPVRKPRYSPNHYPRTLSPLSLNTELQQTITMAPLSPRSAAFVLQNRQILARRQMSPRSPRRSLSRDSSCRRSLTPKRNKLSPRRRSRTPVKWSLSPRKRSLSPRQLSPKRRSNSPRNNHHKRSPFKSKRSSHSPVLSKPTSYKRLGSRPNSRNVSPYADRKSENQSAKRRRTSRSISLSLSPSPDRNYHKRPLNETTGHVNNDKNRRDKPKKDSPNQKEQKGKEDPVLEARRRKFESPVQIGNNGIIKLKVNKTEEETKEENKIIAAKSEESPEEIEQVGEDLEENDEFLDLNPTLDDLWSDEESDDDENEGRFKSKSSSENKNVAIISFRKLADKPVTVEPLIKRYDKDSRLDRKYKHQRRRRSRSPLKSTNKSESKPQNVSENRERSTLDVKSKVSSEKIRSKSDEDEKKKEKNTVIVKSENIKSSDILKTLQSEKNIRRKVKIQKLPECGAGDSSVENSEEPEIIIENDGDGSINKEDDGDLRAEISRRRAQRLIKAGSLAEALPARLLKNALQEVVPKRSTTKQSKVTKGSGSSADRRVLILKRLTSSPAPQLESTNKVTNKEGKLPIHMRLGSNPEVEESVRSERRSKRARTGRRKKLAVQV